MPVNRIFRKADDGCRTGRDGARSGAMTEQEKREVIEILKILEGMKKKLLQLLK